MTSSTYPLTRRALVVGVFLGVCAALASGTPLVGYACFVLCVTVGLTWRLNEAPVFPFILTLQWIQVTSGYFFWIITGELPSTYPAGDVDRTELIALTGLLVLAAGIRLAIAVLPRTDDEEDRTYVQNLDGLFWLVVALYSLNYVSLLNTKSIASLDAILSLALPVRQVPLLLLWYEVIRQQRKKAYLWITLAWTLVPAFGSYFSDFKTPLFLASIVTAAFWKPWEEQWWRFSIGGATRTVAIVVVAVFLALTWQAGVRKETRKAYDTDAVGTDPMERVQLFVSSATKAVPTVFSNTQEVVQGLIARVWYIVFFSRVIDHVPDVEPYANGELLKMAVTNAVMPRFLFPDKAVLPSDSYYTRRFTGIAVESENTSISIGYMAEFYADWGMVGMFLSVFLYGALMGLSAWCVRTFVQPKLLVNPALITTLLTVAFFEHQFIKTFATLIIATILTIGLVRISSRRLVSLLKLQTLPDPEPVDPWYRPRLRVRQRAQLSTRNTLP